MTVPPSRSPLLEITISFQNWQDNDRFPRSGPCPSNNMIPLCGGLSRRPGDPENARDGEGCELAQRISAHQTTCCVGISSTII